MSSESESESESIDKILADILKGVALLNNFKNYVVSFHKNETQGNGFNSEFFTGEVTDKDNDETLQIAIKKAPAEGFNGIVSRENIYKNEICFYFQVFPELDKLQKEKKVKSPFSHIPRYFSGSIESKNLFVAMENLNTAGYVLFDKKKYLDREHLEFIFKTYGKFHALSFVFKHKNAEGYINLVKNLTSMMAAMVEDPKVAKLLENGFMTALGTFDPITEADIFRKLKAIDILETAKRAYAYEGSYKCLIHGDCCSNNMLFKYKESGELEDIKIVDFQGAGSSTPIHDLSYFFYSGASKVDMDKLDYYLDLYYQSFSNFTRELGGNSEELYPLEIFKKEWKQYGAWGICLGLQLWLIKLMAREEIENVVRQKGLTEAEQWELLNAKIAKVNEGAEYKERVRNICLHAVEYGVL